MKPLIAVVDYEMGNLHSVSKALEKAGARVQVTSSASAIRQADGVVLPGVGAFGEAASRLAKMKLIAPLIDALDQDKPFLGICLGLQLLFERSEESEKARGLGVFKGDVVKFFSKVSSPRKRGTNMMGPRFRGDDSLKVPHMGWNTVTYGPAGKTLVMKGIPAGNYFYFVHSFFPAPKDSSLVATKTAYGGSFCSSIARGRMFASQFHPEKSGDQGHRLLSNFVKEVGSC